MLSGDRGAAGRSGDARNKMIVDKEVTNQVVDMGLLQATTEPARAILEVDRVDVVTDAGC
jgi:hypothetical protein